MSRQIIRLGLIGAAGRMGKEIIRQVSEKPTVKLVAGIEQIGSPFIGLDCGELAGTGSIGVNIEESLDLLINKVDVLIDFTVPESTVNNVKFCCEHGLPLVIGTTGLGDYLEFVEHSAQKMPIVMAPNMSIGVNLSFKIVELAAEILGSGFDAEIIEAHHRNKIDAPSGTAIRFGEIVAKKLGVDLSTSAVYGRQGRTGARKPDTIGFETVRAGDIVGDHTVLFAGKGERIEITHRASDRSAFASGAILAAEWLKDKKRGLFDMQDVLGLR